MQQVDKQVDPSWAQTLGAQLDSTGWQLGWAGLSMGCLCLKFHTGSLNISMFG